MEDFIKSLSKLNVNGNDSKNTKQGRKSKTRQTKEFDDQTEILDQQEKQRQLRKTPYNLKNHREEPRSLRNNHERKNYPPTNQNHRYLSSSSRSISTSLISINNSNSNYFDDTDCSSTSGKNTSYRHLQNSSRSPMHPAHNLKNRLPDKQKKHSKLMVTNESPTKRNNFQSQKRNTQRAINNIHNPRGSTESLLINNPTEKPRMQLNKKNNYERKKYLHGDRIPRNSSSCSRSLSSSLISINDLYSNDSDETDCSSVAGENLPSIRPQNTRQVLGQYNKMHNSNKEEQFSIHYIMSLTRKSNDYLLRVLNSQMKELHNFFNSPLRKDHIIPVLEFIHKICSISYEYSKKELLNVALSSVEFIRSISVFIDSIVEYSRTVAETERNLKIVILFYKETVDYVPNVGLVDLNDLLIKTIHMLKKIDDLPPDILKIAEYCRAILYKKLTLTDEKLITYKHLSVFPTVDDIKLDEEVILRPNITNGPYNSTEDYIDIQFKLLKEDFLAGLRSGIDTYLTQIKEKTKIRNHDIFVYNKVTYIGLSENQIPSKKLTHIFELDKKPLSKVQWEVSKRLIHGSLLLFSNDNFKTYFMGVFDDRHGFSNNSTGWSISVLLVAKSLKLKKYSQYVMIEPSVFFEPYYHVLNTLKNFHPQKFPMEKYIIHVETSPKRPHYLSQNAHYVISDIEVSINNLDTWPEPKSIGLNQSQLEALQAALTRELVVIQGPPGTGKTYLGIKLINILLDNKDQWGEGKIFVACYRNNAVDHILDALAMNKRRVVRLGNRSASEILKDSTLRNTVGHLRDPIMYDRLKVLKEELAAIKLKIKELEKIKAFVDENQGILNLEVFNKIIAQNHYNYLSGINSYENWLLGGEEDDGLDNDQAEHFLSSPIVRSVKSSSLPRNHPFVFLSAKSILEELEGLDIELESFILNHAQIYGPDHAAISPEEMAGFTELLTLYHDKLTLFRKLLSRLNIKESETPITRLLNSENLETLSICERWTLYKHWGKEFFNLCEYNVEDLMEEHDIKLLDFLDKRDLNDGENLRTAFVDVIGATTTGAARLNKLLSIAKPKIVILEEAAEVLEAHAIASLTENCEHLILIGDHKQLRPNPASHKSAVKYHLDISLFERMINNGMDCFTLSEQHRMRPEISALVVPQIYPTLSNYPSVEQYPPLRGVKKNLFFVDHRISEDELKDNDSHQNKFEAFFILALAEYLMKQGYEANSITVLTMYGAQLVFMKSIRNNFQNLDDVEIQVVDNFQGEENEIILLSLVRSNSNTVGFLAKENRVCVALTRARQGFIIIGNMETLQLNSSVWKQMKKTFEDSSSLGEFLPLKCETHKRITKVKTREDFKPLHNGGCSFECAAKMNCGHNCTFLCHPMDQEHEVIYTCQQPCIRKRNCGIHDCSSKCGSECPPCDIKLPIDHPCGHKGFKICAGDVLPCKENCTTALSCGHFCPKPCHFGDDNHSMCSAVCNKPNEACPFRHLCPKQCGEECGECTLDTVIELDCGHISTGICNKVRETKCEVLVDQLLNCGHYKMAPCSKPNEEITCEEKVKFLLSCSHEVVAPCQTKKEDIECDVIVEKKLPCGHKEEVSCCTPLNEINCSAKTSKVLKCGHLYEDASCSSPLDELICKMEVAMSLPCGHDVTLPCFSTDPPIQCPMPCNKLLICGHECNGLCGAICPACRVDVKIKDNCGHDRVVPCSSVKALSEVDNLGPDNCKSVCNQLLICGHTCKGTCGECMQGRVHVKCNAVCNKPLICSHRCSNKCWNDFHSCNNKCLNICKHGECERKCGNICSKCMEPCGWTCSHYRCSKKCWEVCDRPPCEFPCQLTLSCGHPCFGYCGEPCPSICLICKPKKEYNIQDRFIKLEDCGHVLSQRDALQLLLNNKGIIVCPTCNCPVLKTNFFRSHAKVFFMKYSKVKTTAQQIYNTRRSILSMFRKNFKLLNEELQKKYEGCDSLNILLQNLVIRTMPIMQYKPFKENELNLKSLLFLCFYVTEALKMTKTDEMDEKHSTKLLLRINHLATYLLSRRERISLTEMHMFFKELVRLRCIIDVMQLEQDRNFIPSEACNTEFYEQARSSVYALKEFSLGEKASIIKCLQRLQKHLSSNYFLLSMRDNDFQKISNFFAKYYLITFHVENWRKCSKGHFFYSVSHEENKICPLCSMNTNNSLYFIE